MRKSLWGISPTCSNAALSIHLSIHLPVSQSVSQPVYLFVSQPVSQSVYLSICQPVSLSIHLSASLSICLSVSVSQSASQNRSAAFAPASGLQLGNQSQIARAAELVEPCCLATSIDPTRTLAQEASISPAAYWVSSTPLQPCEARTEAVSGWRGWSGPCTSPCGFACTTSIQRRVETAALFGNDHQHSATSRDTSSIRQRPPAFSDEQHHSIIRFTEQQELQAEAAAAFGLLQGNKSNKQRQQQHSAYRTPRTPLLLLLRMTTMCSYNAIHVVWLVGIYHLYAPPLFRSQPPADTTAAITPT